MAHSVVTFLVLIHLVDTKFTLEKPQQQMLRTFNGILDIIKSTFPFCSHLNHLFESSGHVLQTNFQEMLTRVEDSHLGVEQPAANLLLDLGLDGNNLDPPKVFFFENNFYFKYHQPCTVIFFQLTSSLLDNAVNLNNATFGRRWPEKILPLLPSPVQRSFFLFFVPEVHAEVASLELSMNELMDQTGMILHSVFIIPVSSSKIHVLKGLPKNSQGILEPVASFESGQFKVLPEKQVFYRLYTDLNGDPLKVLYCPVCGPHEEEYEQTGIEKSPHDFAVRFVAKRFNMTFEIEQVFGVPDTGLKEDGELDDFVLPLADGTAAVTGLLVASHLIDHLVYLTEPYIYDAMLFITGPPKLHNPDPFDALGEPLEMGVWIAGIAASLSVFGCMCIVVVTLKIKRGSLSAAFASVYSPVLDQAGLFGQRAQSVSVSLLLGTWLLGLIVVGNSYKSKLISSILIPHYDYPPRTFAELAESNYELGAVFFATVSNQLATFNTSVNTQLLKRIGEMNFMDPDCYQMIFEGEKACIGYKTAFAFAGSVFMVDIRGRPLELRSLDTHFDGTGVTALSNFYPMIFEPFDYFTLMCDQSGLSPYLKEAEIQRFRKGGKDFALKNVETKKYYAGIKDSLSNDDKVKAVVLQVLEKGLTIAVITFILEFALKVVVTLIWAWRESNKPDSSTCQDKGCEWHPMTMLVVESASSYVYVGELLALGSRNKAVVGSKRSQTQFLL